MNNLLKSLENKNSNTMEVIKRNGCKEKISFDKIISRIESLCYGLDKMYVDPINVAQDTIKSLYNNISTEEIDFVSADICASQIIDHPDFNKLATRLCISNLHKTTSNKFKEVIEQLYNNVDSVGNKCPLVSDTLYNIVQENHELIEQCIDYKKDYNFNFFGIKTLERSYLIRLKHTPANDMTHQKQENKLRKKYGKIIERPQHLFMRVSLGIHEHDLARAFETYELMTNMYFTHATPTMFNSGTPRAQLSSCFLMDMGDSIDGIFKTVSDAAQISKWSGGIGIHISDIRAGGSIIRGTNGTSDGIIPLCKMLSMLAKYVNQGGKRNGSIALYTEPWHADIWAFCELRRPTGEEELRARDLFLALWIPDLFMKRVEADGMWSLMCPDECPGLTDAYGDAFEVLYEEYEKQGRFRSQLKARKLWHHILVSQIETGMPYMVYKDNVNHKTNQKNLGTIKSSNLCAEICEYSDTNSYAVCNLGSICLPRFLEKIDGKYIYNFDKLLEVTKVITYNLDKVIDRNFYPVKECRKSNMENRPIGLGVQGLADVFNILGFAFGSDEARILNRKIFETIYFGALTVSNKIAQELGPYSTYEGSPMSQGYLQFDLWNLESSDLLMDWDWGELRSQITKYGVRNSLVTAVMPTASTSQIMGCVECIEPYTTNLFVRTTIAGEYVVINENLVKDLLEHGLWTKDIKDEIIFDGGSVQNIQEISDHLKDVYKTAFELGQIDIVNQAIERGPFIDQSQSLNIFLKKPDFKRLTKSHFYGWKNGLKTGMYYLRSQPAADPIKFGLDPNIIKKIKHKRGIFEIDNQELDNESDDEIEEDPRRINEIALSLNTKSKNRFSRPDNIEECEMCSG